MFVMALVICAIFVMIKLGFKFVTYMVSRPYFILMHFCMFIFKMQKIILILLECGED